MTSYPRSGVRPGIVHLGLGAFHRSHQAAYLHRLLAAGGDPSWGVCGVGVTPADVSTCKALQAQDGLYSLVLKHPDGSLEHEVIASLVEVLHASTSREQVVARMAEARVVSLTITEGGYASDDHGVFAMIAEALARKRSAGLPPFTVMSCDNVEDNGSVARRALLAAADDPAWLEQHVAFPSSMVDRITPATTDLDRELVRRSWPFSDEVPVVAEPFTQWVLEDRFTDGRPALEQVGVHLVDDVRPYELMKLRLLNAGHQALAYPGLLLGHRLVHDAVADPALAGFLRSFWAEALPTVPPVPGIDLDRYVATLLERFGNPHVQDTLARLSSYASDRIPGFVLPVVRDNLAAGRPVTAAATVVAAWLHCVERELPLVDHGGSWSLGSHVFADLAACPDFGSAVTTALEGLRRDPREALAVSRSW